jgi:hypothetical protein
VLRHLPLACVVLVHGHLAGAQQGPRDQGCLKPDTIDSAVAASMAPAWISARATALSRARLSSSERSPRSANCLVPRNVLLADRLTCRPIETAGLQGCGQDRCGQDKGKIRHELILKS